eukprot:gb/GFBE01034997.1/.p1 GENE.gb/GFBE01034997.1/~~gb/GFBE01034997.1/.p1  ORF type:complete len:254 (+),score=48.97 gb/GFBE01034997.1/:1-762(+)
MARPRLVLLLLAASAALLGPGSERGGCPALALVGQMPARKRDLRLLKRAHAEKVESKKAFFEEVDMYRMRLKLHDRGYNTVTRVVLTLEPCLGQDESGGHGTIEFRGHGVANLVVTDAKRHSKHLPVTVNASLFFPCSKAGPSWQNDILPSQVLGCSMVCDNVHGPGVAELETQGVQRLCPDPATWKDEGPALDGTLTSMGPQLPDAVHCEFQRGVTKHGQMFFRWDPKGLHVAGPSGKMKGLSGHVILHVIE